MDAPPDVTGLLRDVSRGRKEALDHLIPIVYNELRRIAHGQLRREDEGHTLNTFAVASSVALAPTSTSAPSGDVTSTDVTTTGSTLSAQAEASNTTPRTVSSSSRAASDPIMYPSRAFERRDDERAVATRPPAVTGMWLFG